MIKEIFLPDKIGHKRLYTQKIISIAIQENNVSIILVSAKPSGNVVEKILKESLPSASTNDNIISCIKRLLAKVGKYDQVVITIPASHIIFKEIEVPFKDSEKIRMVLDYEIEDKLPFSLDSAIVDFIITDQDQQTNKSQVLVAAIRNQDLEQILSIYKQSGIEPTKATVDLISFYNLYKHIPEYYKTKNGSAIVDLGTTVTRVSFFIDGQLRVTRNIPRGIKTLVTEIQEDVPLEADKILHKLNTYGSLPSGDEVFDKSVQEHLINFFNDIQFSLNSFSLKLNYYKGVSRILLSGLAYEINKLPQFCTELLQIPTEYFAVKKALANITLRKKITQPEQWMPYAIALGSAIPSVDIDEFNLLRKSFAYNRSPIIKKQLLTAMGCFLIIIGTLSINAYFQISHLKQTASDIEKREVIKLLNILPKKERPKVKKLALLVKKAEQMVNDKEELWAAFGKKRIRPLEVLLELTGIMDNRRFKLETEEISFNEKDPGNPAIEIEGYFQSPRGTGFHLTDFFELEQRFNTSTLLIPTEPITGTPAAEKGVHLSVKLKKREEIDV